MARHNLEIKKGVFKAGEPTKHVGSYKSCNCHLEYEYEGEIVSGEMLVICDECREGLEIDESKIDTKTVVSSGF
jgi:hypothetical protein